MSRPNKHLPVALDLASKQHGVVSRQQLLDRGVAARSVSRSIDRFQLFPVFPGVYSVGSPLRTRDGLFMASVLAAGDGAVLGARSAAALWGFLNHLNPIDVMRIDGGRNRPGLVRIPGTHRWPYLVVHQPKQLPATHQAVKRGIGLTSAARTLRDLTPMLHPEKFRLAFMEADRLQLLTEESLKECARHTQGVKGGGAFKEAVRRRISNISEARSLLEAIVLDLVTGKLIPAPEINRMTHAYRPDFRWSEQGVLVEADGYEFHRGREAFENDVLRSNRLRAEGWTVLRFTWRMLTEQPEEVACLIRKALAEGAKRK